MIKSSPHEFIRKLTLNNLQQLIRHKAKPNQTDRKTDSERVFDFKSGLYTVIRSRKLSKLDETNMQDTAGEAGTSS